MTDIPFTLPSHPDETLEWDQIPKRYRWRVPDKTELEASMKETIESIDRVRAAVEFDSELDRCDFDRYLRTLRETEHHLTRLRVRQILLAGDHDGSLERAAQRLVSSANDLREYVERYLVERAVSNSVSILHDERVAEYVETISCNGSHHSESLKRVLESPRELFEIIKDESALVPTVAVGGTQIEVRASNYLSAMQHGEREFRRRFYSSLLDVLEANGEALYTAFQSHVHSEVVQEETAGGGSRGESLPPVSFDISPDAYETLTSTIRNWRNIAHRHVQADAARLGVKEMRMFDTFAPVTGHESLHIRIDEAEQLIRDAASNLDPTVKRIVDQAFEQRWIDAFAYPSKQSTERTLTSQNGHPYVCVCYQETLDSVYTLGHELGHAVHALVAGQHQPFFHTKIADPIAEFVATVLELELTDELLEYVDSPDKETQVRSHHLRIIRNRLFRQYMLYEFGEELRGQIRAGSVQTLLDSQTVYRSALETYFSPLSLRNRDGLGWLRFNRLFDSYELLKYVIGATLALPVVAGYVPKADFMAVLRRGGRATVESTVENFSTINDFEDAVDISLQYYDEMLTKYESA